MAYGNIMLSTTDNPYSPFTRFEDWLDFDISNGYNTCGYLDRLIDFDEELSNYEHIQQIDDAMSEIIKYDLTGNYEMVTRNQYGKDGMRET